MEVQRSANEHITYNPGNSRNDAYLPPSDQPYCQNCKDLDEIVNAIKDKIQVSSKRSAIRLLTLALPVGASKEGKEHWGVITS